VTSMSEAPLQPDYVLLVNARPDKGFDLMLEVAAGCPQIRFAAIASQSPSKVARAAVDAAGLRNVTILEKTNDIGSLYHAARLVIVPSYRFVETFSRVCIEAQRFGKPVIGSNVGNVPNLLEQSGVVLTDSVPAWIDEVRRHFEDPQYYAHRCRLALENSQRYSEVNQRRDLNSIVDFVGAPILVGIGSGIGNMLHAGPMIRNIARRTGRRVDLVVSEDHSDSLFLLHHPDYVNSVFSLRPAIIEKPYETVFITHSFGAPRVNFAGDKVIWSRDWDLFAPGTSQHETIFNLDAAKQLLGIDYDEQDINGHYIADIDYVWPGGNIVGFHGGSKGGHWASKRWNGFPELAQVLSERGFEVRSYGVPSEHVPGTRDMTGGSIEQMAKSMRECSYFVSNDSGVMNIANALGIPMLALFAPTEQRTREPLSPTAVSLSVRKSCSPCEVKNPPHFSSGACTCIDEISLGEVLEKFDGLVARVHSSVPSAAEAGE